jgi:hypothetical protein
MGEAGERIERGRDEISRSAVRDRKRPLKVVVSDAERAKIMEYAQATGLTLSAYLRTVGLRVRPRSMLDQYAILDLLRVAADQGRLGGLLKLWLSAKEGQGAPASDVRHLLRQIENLQLELRGMVRELRRKKSSDR